MRIVSSLLGLYPFCLLIFYGEFLDLGFLVGFMERRQHISDHPPLPTPPPDARKLVKGASPVPGTLSLFNLGLFIHSW